MKKSIFLFAVVAFLLACNDQKKEDNESGEMKDLSGIELPYEVQYKDLTPGDPNHAKTVLEFFKAWDENRLVYGKSMLNDTVAADFADGTKFSGTADSLISMGNQYRANFTTVKTVVDACMSVRSKAKNEDWVLVWDKTYTTDLKGTVDSMGQHSFWMMKNGKIAYWGELQARLAPPPSPPPVMNNN